MAAAAENGCDPPPILWRDCVRWLVDVGILPASHKVNQPQGTDTEFVHLLRDGILLCRLVNEILPDSVNPMEFPQQPSTNTLPSEFQCQKIICLFLGACQKGLNLKDEDLFVAYELYKATNFAKVLDTLSIISYSEPCLKRGIRPFPPQDSQERRKRSSCFPHVVPSVEEDIYRHLEDDVDNVEVDAAIYDVGPYKNMYGGGEESTKIYDHIVARQDSKREYKTDPWSLFTPQTKREYCIKELMDTEKNYVEKGLTLIVNKFFYPLESCMKEKDREMIFLNINELYNFHVSFANDLQETVFRTLHLNETTNGRPKSLSSVYIGDVFKIHKDKFLDYAHYCMGLETAKNRIDELEKSDFVVKAKVKECSEKADYQFKLQDLLFLPVQRILKYHLLLAELIKATPIESPDRKSLETAKDIMDDVNAYINEMKRDAETCNLIKEVQKSISDLIMPDNVSLLDYGRLNTDCEVRLSQSADRDSGKLKQRHIFVFDKVLIICQSKKNNTYVYKGAFVLNELSIDNDHSDNKFGTITKKLAGQNLVYLIRDPLGSITNPMNKEIRFITLAFKSKPLMEKWIDQFNKARENVNPPETRDTGHKAHYTTFKGGVHKCYICDKLLKGLIYQGYKCETCSHTFHRNCLSVRPCAPRRPSAMTPTPSMSSSDRRRASWMYGKGDQVMATTSLSPTDSSFLPLTNHELLEVISVTDEGLLMACPATNRARQGLVNANHVRKIRNSSLASTPVDRKISRIESTVLPRRPLNVAPTPIADYMNTEVHNQIWYMGEIERDECEKKLKPTPDGTFIVRFSNNRKRYALSISYQGEVKHTIVEQSEEGRFFLDDGFVFNSIVELVNYYKVHNLCESFNSLNTVLKSPYRECKIFKVIHDYSAGEAKFLNIKKGDILTLIDTIGEDRGWWKGALNNRVGFFPLTYVEEFHEEESP